MRGHHSASFAFLAAACLAIACGGSAPPPAVVDADDNDRADIEQAEALARPAPGDEADSEEEVRASESVAEPEFREGMSVEEAINAVPQGTERENIDQETLARPLMDANLYAPCKPAANAHFKLKVAVWGGRAVGIDVEAKPKNDKLASCVKEQVSQLEWRDKVKSLNTVEFSY
jgi:hypothetical protein